MSETSETTPVVEEVEEVTPLRREDLDDFGERMMSQIDEYATQAQKDSDVIKAYKADDSESLVVLLRDDDEQYQNEYLPLVAQAEALLAEIDARNLPNVVKPTEEEFKAAEASFASMKEQGKYGINFLASTPIGEGIRALMPEILKSRKGSSGVKGETKRPRMQSILVTDTEGNELVNLNDTSEKAVAEDKPTFSALAKWLTKDSGVKSAELTKELQAAAFDKAGTKDLSTVTKVEFGKTLGDKHYEIVAVSKVK
jgi:hypothetical protein